MFRMASSLTVSRLSTSFILFIFFIVCSPPLLDVRSSLDVDYRVVASAPVTPARCPRAVAPA
jgi:hypothetical protein